jgi:hypothetical protein
VTSHRFKVLEQIAIDASGDSRQASWFVGFQSDRWPRRGPVAFTSFRSGSMPDPVPRFHPSAPAKRLAVAELRTNARTSSAAACK